MTSRIENNLKSHLPYFVDREHLAALMKTNTIAISKLPLDTRAIVVKVISVGYKSQYEDYDCIYRTAVVVNKVLSRRKGDSNSQNDAENRRSFILGF